MTNKTKKVTKKLTPEIINSLALAQIAEDRENYNEALKYYLEATELSLDPEVAEKAQNLAKLLGDDSSLRKVAEIWQKLNNDPDPLVELARIELEQGSYKTAINYLQKLENYEDEITFGAYSLIGQQLVSPKAQRAYVLALHALCEPTEANVRQRQACIEAAIGMDQARLALDFSSKALKYFPKAQDIIVLQAKIYYHLGEFDTAVAKLSESIKTVKDNGRLKLLLAEIYLDRNQNQAAKKVLLSIEKETAFQYQVNVYLGQIALLNNKLAQAKNHFTRAINSSQAADSAFYYLGKIAELEHNSEQAISWFQKITQGAYYLDAQVHAARLWYQADDLAQAINLLNEVQVYTEKDFQQICNAKVEILSAADELEAAYDSASFCVDNLPNNVALRFSRGLFAYQTERQDIFENDMRQIIKLAPNHLAALKTLGMDLSTRPNNYAEAKELLAKASELEPNNADLLHNLGWLQFRLGNSELALNSLKQAFQLQSRADIALDLAEVLWSMQYQQEALQILKLTLGQNPNHKLLQAQLRQYNQQLP